MEQFLLLGANPITGFVNDMMQRLLLWIDSGVYKLVAMSYQLFVYLSSAQIFSNEFFENFALRIYAILGVFMLFYLGYALLNAIVDPDKNLSGEKGAGKIAFNLVKALVLIGLLPTVFSYAMRLQNFILSENIIGTIILGTTKEDTDDALVSFGDKMSFTAMHAFINPDDYEVTMEETGRTWKDMVNNELLAHGDYSWLPDLAPWVIYDGRLKEDGKDVKVKYLGIISTITGIILVYIILSFTLDLGVRVVKLAFCQLIAPIPIVLGILPSRKSTMDKWVKLTLSTYFEVFVRVAIMYLLVYFMSQFGNTTLFASWSDGWLGKFAIVVIMLGLFAFAKQLPKLISDTLGLDTSSIKFGIRDKLKTSVEGMDATIGRVPGVKRIAGATTGALGAGWTAFVNKGQIGNAVKYGAFKGIQGGGNQFNAQRKKLYTEYGLKGPAGWLGGRALVNTLEDKFKNDAQNAYAHPETGSNTRWLEAIENNSQSRWTQIFNGKIEANLDNIPSRYRDRVRTKYEAHRGESYSARMQVYDDEIKTNNDIIDNIDNAISEPLKRAREEYIGALMRKRDSAAALGNTAQVTQINSQIEMAQHSDYVNPEFKEFLQGKTVSYNGNDVDILDLQNRRDDLADKNDVLQQVKQLEETTRTETIGQYGKENPEYKRRAELRNKEANEAKDKSWKLSDEGRRQSALFDGIKQAVKDSSKDGK